ncbi:MAG: hypothetical protein AVO35_09980 [Candidatus Aegiribacteria sp. MLS_C]|nr:MAG: hypothetical protein AVO35_09980 [Candidatus Aegiribacteria sp. MLS_C]
MENGPDVSIRDSYGRMDPSEKRAELVRGLENRPMSLPSRYFYDRRGSRLFREITRLEEYYPARTEKAILRNVLPGIIPGMDFRELVELGSGDCSKISMVLESIPEGSLAETRYIPVDVSRSAMETSALELLTRFPGLRIRGIVADFCRQLDEVPEGRRRLFLLFSGTVGNFEPDEAKSLLKGIADQMEEGDSFIMGVDMLKERSLMEDAYDDIEGVTACFNRNILNVTGGILSADIPSKCFDHLSFFNDDESRMEMHPVARSDIRIEIPHLEEPLRIRRGERIHTENSYKYTTGMLEDLAEGGGMRIMRMFSDCRDWFSLVEMEAS